MKRRVYILSLALICLAFQAGATDRLPDPGMTDTHGLNPNLFDDPTTKGLAIWAYTNDGIYERQPILTATLLGPISILVPNGYDIDNMTEAGSSVLKYSIGYAMIFIEPIRMEIGNATAMTANGYEYTETQRFNDGYQLNFGISLVGEHTVFVSVAGHDMKRVDLMLNSIKLAG